MFHVVCVEIDSCSLTETNTHTYIEVNKKLSSMRWLLLVVAFSCWLSLNHGLNLNRASRHSSTELNASSSTNFLNRLHASEAATMIRNAYDEQKVITLITSDASRGSVSALR